MLIRILCFFSKSKFTFNKTKNDFIFFIKRYGDVWPIKTNKYAVYNEVFRINIIKQTMYLAKTIHKIAAQKYFLSNVKYL